MNGIWKSGQAYIWLTGGALAFCVLMIAGLIGLVVYNGLGFFWPTELTAFRLNGGALVMGQIWDRQEIPDRGEEYRVQLKVANRDAYGVDFRWVDESSILDRTLPVDAVVFERREWGQLFGFVDAVYEADDKVAGGGPAGWTAFQMQLRRTGALLDQVRDIERNAVSDLGRRTEKIRLEKRRLELAPDTRREQVAELEVRNRENWTQYESLAAELNRLRAESEVPQLDVRLAGGEIRRVAVADVVRAYRPNNLSVFGKTGVYLERVWEFLSAEPRESNTEGGVFPAIFGTVLMVILMSLAAVPFGVLAALYLREYARQGPLVRAIRIAVNNLAGVPSIVFGMFGLGFFVYGVGGNLDRLFFPEALPAPTFGTGGILWASLTLALLTVPVMIVASEEALASVPGDVREGSLALGATQFQTIWRVVLPAALPGILTGIVLVVARGAGEVAPLMITGVVKLAPTLPVDGAWPFFHLERKFMHLGFHIYDVGFQSPNVEAARPMVYTTTLLLMFIVLALNLTAIQVRSRLRKRYQKIGL